jgi:hypothetical protein
MHVSSLLWLALLCRGTRAEIYTYDFNITWVTANPDALQARPVVGINGQWPIPTIKTTVGDRIIVRVHNQLGNQSTSLHFHGLFLNGATEMDGAPGVSQCSLPPGSSMTYNLTVGYNQPSINLQAVTNPHRLINRGHTGTIHTTIASIPMGCGDPWSSKTPTRHTKESMTASTC